MNINQKGRIVRITRFIGTSILIYVTGVILLILIGVVNLLIELFTAPDQYTLIKLTGLVFLNGSWLYLLSNFGLAMVGLFPDLVVSEKEIRLKVLFINYALEWQDLRRMAAVYKKTSLTALEINKKNYFFIQIFGWLWFRSLKGPFFLLSPQSEGYQAFVEICKSQHIPMVDG